MKPYRFNSMFEAGLTLPEFTQDQVKNEPMLFNCDWETAMTLGGPITMAFLRAIHDSDPGAHKPVVIDTRVHMLMPGWFPAIPGFHHDDVPRGDDGQPNYDDPAYYAMHCMALVNGDVCPTEFAVGTEDYPRVLPGEGPIYKKWHLLTEEYIEKGYLRREVAPTNTLIWFDWQAFHQGVEAKKNGWRWFGRATWNTDRVPTNEIRRQVQVYLANPMEGW